MTPSRSPEPMPGMEHAATTVVDGPRGSGLAEDLRPPLGPDEAVVAAERCLGCGGPYAPAPCTVACPADIDVPGFVGAVAAGDDDAASRTIFADNLLGGTCARVCPVEVLCEGHCVLNAEGRRPVEIGRLQRYACDRPLADGTRLREAAQPATGRTVAVIGAGPAGLAAAGELALRGHRVVVYDERDEPGGLVRFAIAPFRQRREPLPAEARHVESLGVELHLEQAIGSPERLAALAGDADAVVLAVGMGEDVEVRYDGDDLPGVYESLPFIAALKTDHPLPVGERVVVIGGGNTAVDCAREARRLGASVVTLAYRRSEAEMPAYAHEVAEAREEDIEFHWLANPKRFLGYGRLNGVECVEMRLGEADASGRHQPEPVAGSEFVIEADTAIKAIGQRPRSELLSWIEGLELVNGRIAIDPETGATANPKFFAAGDAVSGGSMVVEAVRQAKIAARGVDAMLGATP
jgi:dihydropyrimidine dehydrogenase (NAD+) subunit PreT